jgi:hypothetical protein
MAESNEPAADGHASTTKKKWYWVGAGILAAGFLTAAGAWGFSLITSAVDGAAESQTVPFNAQLAEASDCEVFLIDESLVEEVPVDADGEIDETWITENGGLQSSPRDLELTLVGSEEAVVINSISIIDIEHVPLPAEPTRIGECKPVGGESGYRYLSLDYNTGSTKLTDATDMDRVVKLTVGAGATPEVISFITPGVTETNPLCYCTWRLEIAWTSATREGKTVVDLDGEPISLVAPGDDNGHYHWIAEDGTLRWLGDGLPP